MTSSNMCGFGTTKRYRECKFYGKNSKRSIGDDEEEGDRDEARQIRREMRGRAGYGELNEPNIVASRRDKRSRRRLRRSMNNGADGSRRIRAMHSPYEALNSPTYVIDYVYIYIYKSPTFS